MEVIEGTRPKDRLEWALALAAKGFKVLALRPNDKRPVSGRAWGVRATSNPDEIRAMFAELPGMNYGVCPGSGFVVIDLDTKHAPEGGTGLDRFGELELEHGVTPETFHVRTRSDGLHIFLRVSEEVGNANKFPDGIDVRGGGGCRCRIARERDQASRPRGPAPGEVRNHPQGEGWRPRGSQGQQGPDGPKWRSSGPSGR